MADEQEYVVSLQRPNYRYVNWISQLLLVLFLISFFYYAATNGQKINVLYYCLPLFIVGFWGYGLMQKGKPTFLVYYRTELMMAAMGWFFLPIWKFSFVLGFVYGTMALVERWVKHGDEIVFSTENVKRKRIFSIVYEWFEIDNVMIRDNLFTMDLRNNSIIQKLLDEPITSELADEFNAFCKQQLHFSSEEKPNI